LRVCIVVEVTLHNILYFSKVSGQEGGIRVNPP
jgi:hypothetical protein